MQAISGPKTLLLIDANSLIHRFFHALPPFTTPDGAPIGAIYGLAQVMLKIFREIKPTHIAACFDRPEPTFRDEMYKEYKAHRPPTAEGLIPQIQRAHDLFDKFKVKTFEIPGFEADDLIGTLATKFGGEPELRVVIFSGDLDTLQLIQGEKVIVQFLLKGITETKLYNEAAVAERYELKPSQLPDLKGLVGDASDNIPGVKGVGPKTAIPLIKEFESLEGVYDSLSIIPEKVAKKLRDAKEIAMLSKKLAVINRNAPLFLDSVDDLRATPLNLEELKNYFAKLGFQSLVRRISE